MKETACGAIIYRETSMGREYLILKHKNAGHWFFPKGKIEKDESKMQCAKREILEETGLKNLEIAKDFVLKYSYDC